MKNTAVTQFSQISDDAVKWAASAKKGDKKVFRNRRPDAMWSIS